MAYPREIDVHRQRPRSAHLKNSDGKTEKGKEGQANPVAKRATRELFNRVSFRLASKFVTVQRNDEEILDILADDLAVVSPEGRDGIEDKREGVQTNIPKLLITVSNVLIQGGDLRKLTLPLAILRREWNG